MTGQTQVFSGHSHSNTPAGICQGVISSQGRDSRPIKSLQKGGLQAGFQARTIVQIALNILTLSWFLANMCTTACKKILDEEASETVSNVRMTEIQLYPAKLKDYLILYLSLILKKRVFAVACFSKTI